MNKTKDNLVIVLAKKPTLSKTKTRIAKDTTKSFAKLLSEASLSDLLNNISNSNFFDVVVSTDTHDDLRWFEKNYNINGFIVNEGGDLDKGGVISESFRIASQDFLYKKIILIPMDRPFVTVDDLISSFSRMDSKDFVVGPEMNGGVYLIGMVSNKVGKDYFSKIRWSTKDSYGDLIKSFGRENSYILKLSSDINTFQDILNYKDRIKMSCPKLYDLLYRNGYYISDEKRYVNFDDLNICIPTVSAIVERKKNNKTQILIQTRYKPSIDPEYSGLLEIPSGLIGRYESARDAIIREVFEETGLAVTVPKSNIGYVSRGGDIIVNYSPFLCGQQIKKGRSYINSAFICHLQEGVDGEALLENIDETRNVRWVDLDELKELVSNPEQFFPLVVPIINKYLESK